MAPYRKSGHSATLWLTVVTRDGRKVRVTTGTHDLATAEDMELMLRTLGRRGSRDWDLLDALTDQDPAKPHRRRLALPLLYDAWIAEQRWRAEERRPGEPSPLERLRDALSDVDLAPSIDEWIATLPTTHRAETTAKMYAQRVGSLAPAREDGTRPPLWRSQFTPEAIAARKDRLPGGVESQLAYFTAWSAWAKWLKGRGLLKANPLERVEWPKRPKGTKRVRHIARLADVQRFVAAFPTLETRAIAALRESTGADWDALGPMRREHIVDRGRRLVYLPGDKTDNRPREVEVEAWAWVHVVAHLDATPALPGAPVFRMTQRKYNDHHREACAALRAAGAGIPDKYTPHCGRHSFAVRKRRAGWPDWKIAAYLGNTAQEVAKTYGAFQPTRDDLRHDRTGGDA